MRVFLDLAWYFKQERKKYTAGILILMAVSALTLIPPYVVGIIVDAITENRVTSAFLWRWLAVLAAIGVSSYILRYIWRIFIFGASIKLARQLRDQLYRHYLNMSFGFYQRRRTGDLMAHATNDIRAVEQTAGAGVLTLVDSVTMGGFVIAAMAFLISWELTLIALIPMPLMAYLTSRYGTMLHQRFKGAQEAFSDLNNKVQESMSGIRVTKAFGMEEKDQEDFRYRSEEVVKKNEAVARVDALFDPTISLVVGSSYLLTVVFGSVYVVSGDMTIGQLTSFTVYLGLLIWPMLAFGWFFNIVERGRASYDRIRGLLKESPDVQEAEKARAAKPEGDISVSLEKAVYPGTEEGLHHVHFHVPRGSTVGIAGRTGSGKSTLLRLLMRDMDPQEGFVMVDGTRLEEYRLDALRGAGALVPQDHFLFSQTIRENLLFASPDAGEREMKIAAEAAGIHNDIQAMPDGYETFVGERGVTLSGGQKQRLSIARALLKNPEMLFIDDALSAVDAETEAHVLAGLKKARRGRTTFITSHRMSTISHADLIIVLDDGWMTEKGTHEELMQSEGWYKWMHQAQQLSGRSEVE
ncbi:ABC transporter transmembrane domain-containing protein [Alkalicoccus urumqiensis]|uniref:Multidrug ABC transporter permease/ATP-binding protein n=1 Tax=Alkalicoccus urumqiensis TaxID=1548213 RepID=A0A2P6MDU7_ALKUR|nr:ABC transporter transmembrane domain-containing protein [Alkalicoccus urumqiensis]PRO64461.1 multidrug ABC transporter permease/ATP-binding protein [Alkalicoccus urumqiensis]